MPALKDALDALDADHKCFECGTDLTVVCLRCNPLAEAPPPPAGDMRLVPREATEAMLVAGRRAQADVPEVKSFPPGAVASWNVKRHSYRGKDYETFEHAKDAQQQEILAIEYRAMLSAAPLPARAESALRPGKTVR